MKKRRFCRSYCVLLLIVFCLAFNFVAKTVYAVSEATCLFLLISPSPQANAMGHTYGTLAVNEPMAAVFNPASLGLFAQNFYIGASFYPTKTQWLPQFGPDMGYNCFATNVGVNLQRIVAIPISFGMGYNHICLDLGEQRYRDEEGNILGTFKSYEYANSITVAAAIDFYLRVSVGFSYKNIESKLGPPNVKDGKASVNACDFGFILEMPIIEISRKLFGKSSEIEPKFQPFLKPGLFQSRKNVGGEVSYVERAQADPLPRSAYVGAYFKSGLLYKKDDFSVNIISFNWAQEAQDILVRRDRTKWEYRSGLGDINIVRNIILGHGSSEIEKMKGWQLGACDVFFIRGGHLEDMEGRRCYKTEGFGINLSKPIQILYALNMLKADHWLTKLLLCLDIEYHSSSMTLPFEHPLYGTKFKGFVVKLKNSAIDF